MHLERYGTGTEIYLGLHGWGGDHTTFAPLAAYLPADVSLLSADLPGCGQSPAPPRWELSAITDEIVATLARIAAPAVTLIGNCSGALLGLLAARRCAQRVRRLVLIDPFAYWPWYFKIFVTPGFGKYAYYATFANPLGRWLTNNSLRGKRTPRTHLTRSFASLDHEVAHRYLAMLGGIEGVAQFADLRLPIDIIYGARTFGAIKKSAAMWGAIWPQACCWELPGAGHLPLEEAAPQLSAIIFDQAEPAVCPPAAGALRRRELTIESVKL